MTVKYAFCRDQETCIGSFDTAEEAVSAGAREEHASCAGCDEEGGLEVVYALAPDCVQRIADYEISFAIGETEEQTVENALTAWGVKP